MHTLATYQNRCRMYLLCSAPFLLFVVSFAQPAAAQFEGVVADQLSQTTLTVLTMSIEQSKKIERSELKKILDEVADEGIEEVLKSYDEVMAQRDQLDEMGVTDIAAFIDGLEGPTGAPRMVFHVRQGNDLAAAANGVAKTFDLGEPSHVDEAKRVLYFGNMPVDKSGESQRARFETLTKVSSNAALRVYFAPSDDQLRVLREMLPPLPPPFQAFTGEMLTSAAQAGVFAIIKDDALRFELTAIGDGRDSSEALAKAVKGLREGLKPYQAMLPPNVDLSSLIDRVKVADDQPYTQLTLTSADSSLGTAIGLLFPPILAARTAARRTQDMNTLKQLGLAQHNYHDTHKTFAPRYSVDDDGKPLLSWRVALLPFLNEQELYESFHLDEPWDSEHNRKLIEKMPDIYRSQMMGDVEEGKTVFEAVVMEGSLYGERVPPQFRDIRDGTSNTIMLLEAPAELAVTWTKPADVELEYDKLVEVLSKQEGFQSTFCDGSVRYISTENLKDLLKKLLTTNGGEVIGN